MTRVLKQLREIVESFVAIALVSAGIAGIAYHLFRPDGWVETMAGELWELHVRYPLVAIPATILAVALGKWWHDNRRAHGRQSKVPDFFVYALIGCGIYFIGHYAIYGTF